jgi:NADH-quinone oxidoreductase subunit H
MSLFDWIQLAAKTTFVLVVLIHVAPIMAWVERRGSALMQNRLGPNRIGPLGLLQSAADGIKFIFKEDIIPGHVDKFYYLLAPILSLIPSLMGFAVVPFASTLDLGDGRIIQFQVADLNVGLLYVLSIASLGVYGIIMGGWASNNKYALLGSLRSSSQMISYELSMGLSIVGVLMCFNTVHLSEIAAAQGQALVHLNLPVLGEIIIRKYGFFLQPLGGLIFVIAAFAETNRLPFDLPEGESEIVAGYHLEYGSMKFAMFMMAEYINMFTASALISTFYFGGWQILPGLSYLFAHSGLTGFDHELVRVMLELTSFFVKVGFFMWFFVWVRWTLPRFRYDQVMDLGWKLMLPLSMLNIVVTSVLIYLGKI